MEVVADARRMNEAIAGLADAIAAHPDPAPLALVGIHTGGVPLARRLHAHLSKPLGGVALGELDVTLYRDDGGMPARFASGQMGTEIAFDVSGMRIVLVDDVLFTGRTVRAAIDQIMDFGRPAKIELAVLVDRGNRQLPIHADYVGFTLKTSPTERVKHQLPINTDYVGFTLKTSPTERVKVELSELGMADHIVRYASNREMSVDAMPGTSRRGQHGRRATT